MKESHPVVHIVGAGPGDPELLTLKGRRLLEEADLVLYAGSLVIPRILACCGPEARKVDSAPLSLEAQVDLLAEAALEGLRVVRLHTGDPSLYGAIGEQIRPLRERGVEVRLVPGVSSLQAAAAALGVEYTVPGGTQTLVCTRAPGRTPVPEAESLRVLAATGATLAVFLSAEHAPAVVASCLEAGLAPDTPAAWVYRASWPDQRVGRTTLEHLASSLEEAGIRRHALLVIGRCLDPGDVRSLLYHPSFAHGHRPAEEPR